MFELNHYNDEKEKYQSHEITIQGGIENPKLDVHSPDFTDITGYGETEEEATFDFIRKAEYVLEQYSNFLSAVINRFKNNNENNEANKTKYKFSGAIDCSTAFELFDITEEEYKGIQKFLDALDSASCSYTDIKSELTKEIFIENNIKGEK